MRLKLYQFERRWAWPAISKSMVKGIATLLLSSILIPKVSGYAFAQKVTIKETKRPIYEVLEKIRAQANADLLGDLALLKESRPVTIDANNRELRWVLQEISTTQNVEFLYQNNAILVMPKSRNSTPKTPTAVSIGRSEPSEQQQITVRGTVVDEEGRPLEGVSIKVLHLKDKGTLSNTEGGFAIAVAQKSKLVFSMVGYESRTIDVAERLDVVLKVSATDIEETIVTGYSTIKREQFTGAATVITREELEKFNATNIFTVLQALDPAFKVDERVEAGSDPNTLPQINIRGVSSVGMSSVNTPLVIMDGFEVSISTLYDMDVNRIESISILKDASSTSLYGSRGGNGVLVIETRMPKEGKFTVTYNARPSMSFVDLSDYNLMNAQEKLTYEKLAGLYTAPLIEPEYTLMQQEVYDNLLAKREADVLSGVDTYWLRQPVRNTFSVNHSLRFEGGANGVRYSLEGGYFDNKGVMKESGRKRGNAGFSLIYRIPNRITFRNITTYIYTNAYTSPYGRFSAYARMNPYEKMYNEDGSYIIRFGDVNPTYRWGPAIFNPLYNTSFGYRDQRRSQQIQNNLSLEWFIGTSFILRGSGAISRTTEEVDKYRSPFGIDYFEVEDPSMRGAYTFGNSTAMNYEGRLDLQYSKMFDRHQIVAKGVGELRSQNTTGNQNTVTGFIDDRFMTPQMALRYEQASLPVSTSLPVRSVGFLGSLFYTFDNKYNFSATLRSDGASIYGSRNRFGTFWSTGLSYNLHNEKWFENSWLTRARIFANLGSASSISSANVGIVSTAYTFEAGNNYYRQYAALYSGQGNPLVRWPEQFQQSMGAEFGIKGDLLRFDLSLYNRTTNRMISTITVAPSFGFYQNTFYQNLGKVQNRGFEASANIRVLSATEKDLSWYISAGAVQNRGILKRISNELRSMNESLVSKDDKGNIIKPSLYYEEGQSLHVLRAVPSLGIDPANGRELFRDRNGNVTYTWDTRDQQIVGNGEETLFGTLGSTFNFRGLSVQIIGNYSLGMDVYNQTLMDKIENNSPFINADKRVLQERWREPGDVSKYKAIDDQSVTQISSRFVQRESFLRLSAININYTFDKRALRRYKLERLRLNFSMNDALRLSTVRMERGISFPYAREYNFGVMIQF